MPLSPDLLRRVVSAVILAPIVLSLVWLGGWPFWALMLAVFAICVYEALSLSLRTRWPVVFAPATVIYLAVAMTSFVLLREKGPLPVFALLLAVWMTDIGAYAAGRAFGGPKMAPSISPNKTWAGLGGGMAGSILVLVVFSLITPGHEDTLMLVVIGAVLACVGQIGDLLESFLKRQAQAKDSGALIPGHGGLLDRVDGLLLCAPVFLFALEGIVG